MNILGLVSMFLLLFTFLTLNFQHESYRFQKVIHEECACLRKKEKALKNMVEKAWVKIKRDQKPKKSSPTKDREKKIECREEEYPACTKCNLYMIKKGSHPSLKFFAKTLLYHLLDQHELRLPIKKRELFFTALLEKLSPKKNDPVFLENLSFEEPDLSFIYYQLLKGKPNIPSLLDFWKYEERESKLCVPCLKKLSLETLFGKTITKTLLSEKEKEEELTKITKKKLQLLLSKEGRVLEGDLEKILVFSHKKQKQKISIKLDENEKIALPEELVTFPKTL